MIITPGFVGCDISKHHLDLFDGAVGRPERIANQPEAIAARLEAWRGRGVLVLFEATGPYDLALRRGLEAAGIAWRRVNPAMARAFAKATGQLAKTDAIDARLLASMAMALQPAPDTPVSPASERLARLVARRDQLVGDRTREKGRREAAGDPHVLADIDSHVAELERRIAALQAAIDEHVATAPDLVAKASLLRSVPGLGPVAATVLLAIMPELGQRSPKAIAALAGLAPINRDSGQRRGTRMIQGGRTRVRRALYMAALGAIRSKQRFAQTYKTMTAAGKPPKVALIAIARKLITIANAVIRDGRPFQRQNA